MVISLLLQLLLIFYYNVDTMTQEKVREREGEREERNFLSLLSLPLLFSAFPTLTLMNE